MNRAQNNFQFFLKELNDYAERGFGDEAQQMIDSFLYAKKPPHLKNSINFAYLENGTHEQIVAHLKRELELSSIENDGELPIPTMTVAIAGRNENKTDLSMASCLYCKKCGHLIKDSRKNLGKTGTKTRPCPKNRKILA